MALYSYQIAAAILIEKNSAIHYRELTKLVVDTHLSELGNIDKDSTHQTLYTRLKYDHPEFFIFRKGGYFSINTSKANDPVLNSAKKAYNDYLQKMAIKARNHALEDELAKTVSADIEAFQEENIELTEGKIIERLVSFYERKRKLVEAAIKLHGTKCMVPNCGFDYEKIYGIRGKDYIEVHHIIPLSTKVEENTVNPKTDLVVVCANCYRMIHRRRNESLTLEQLGEIISSCNPC